MQEQQQSGPDRRLLDNDQALQVIRTAWLGSAPDRRLFAGPLMNELYYYLETSMGEISCLLHRLHREEEQSDSGAMAAVVRRVEELFELCNHILRYIFAIVLKQ